MSDTKDKEDWEKEYDQFIESEEDDEEDYDPDFDDKGYSFEAFDPLSQSHVVYRD